MKRLFFLLVILSLFYPAIAHLNSLPSSNFTSVVTQIKQQGDKLIVQYSPQSNFNALQGVTELYFTQYEARGMEVALAALAPNLNIKTEGLFTELIAAISAAQPNEKVLIIWQQLQSQLDNNLIILNTKSKASFTQVVLQAFNILLREGIEAMLIILAMLSYLHRQGENKKAPIIYIGIGLAGIASVITAWTFAVFLKNMGAYREALEGIIMLIAAAVMFYVSCWLVAQAQFTHWKSFLHTNIANSLSSKKTWVLGLVAFLAVYREGAETILFYQALYLSVGQHADAIILGFGAAALVLAIVYQLLKTASYKLPYKFFFGASAFILYWMTFTFIGKGILELQEAGWIPITLYPLPVDLSWLGIFPIKEPLIMQTLFLIMTLGLASISYYRQKVIDYSVQRRNN